VEPSILISAASGLAGAIIPLIAFGIRLANRISEHDAKIAAIERFHDTLLKRMVDVTISPHTPELDDILRKMRDGLDLTHEEIKVAVVECDREFHAAKNNGAIGRAAALSVILAQLSTKL
jgi:hypothetical protein